MNAQNKQGETPIFTTMDERAIPLLVRHGADLTIRNNKGQTVLEAAGQKDLSASKPFGRPWKKLSVRDESGTGRTPIIETGNTTLGLGKLPVLSPGFPTRGTSSGTTEAADSLPV